MINYKPIIYGFQISIYKENIFTLDYLIKCYKILMNNLNISFKLQIDKSSMYFFYIFDYSRIDSSEYKTMIKYCKLQELPYIFFNIKNNLFYSQKDIIINNITSLSKRIFNKNNNHLIEEYFCKINYKNN